MTADPFGTRAMRERVLASWVSSPVRFREDSNAEEDLALHGYRDRLVVELAQNAADAAARAHVPGDLLLRVAREPDDVGGRAVLVAANTGTPLDADGVQGLATLRASAKRDALGDLDDPFAGAETVGRFGVGFAAVLTVTDEPALLSRTGGVRFSAGDSRTLVAGAAEHSPGLREELARREGHVPVLRLPFETEGAAPAGYDTAVVLPLRDAAAEELVLNRLEEVGDDLLLALPGLHRITVEVPGRPARVMSDVQQRWRVWRAVGRHAPEDLADRPTEERRRLTWQVTWALPRDVPASLPGGPGDGSHGPGVVHAPTRTDEPLDWPALLIGSFPLDSTRRHVAPGRATDALIAAAADLYVDALRELAEAGTDVVPLVPVGFPTGPLDGALRARVLDRLPDAAVLPVIEAALPADEATAPEAVLARPREAVALELPAGADDAVLQALAPSVAGLVRTTRAQERVLRRLGVTFLPLADLVEALPEHDDLARWSALYGALAPLAVDPLVRESLAGLPVPLADGRVVRGARGLLLPLGGLSRTLDSLDEHDAEVAARLGLRVVHPQVAHELLERLGAVPAGPRAVLEQPSVRAAVEDSPDAEDPAGLAGAVLALVAAAVDAGELAPGDLPWLGDLALPDAEGDLAPAAALALPGSAAARLLDPGEIGEVHPDELDRWGAAALAAAGVLDDLGVLRVADLAPAQGDEAVAELDGFEDWWDEVCDAVERAGHDPQDALVPEFAAVLDLDAVLPEARPDLMTHLAAQPRTRAALVGPTRVVVGPAVVETVTYTAWWLSQALASPAGVEPDGGSAHDLPGTAEPEVEVAAARFADPEAEPLVTRLLPPAPEAVLGLDATVRAAVGAVRRVEDLDAAAVPVVVAALADPRVPVGVDDLVRVTRRLAELAGEAADLALLLTDPPRAVRAIDVTAPGGTRVVPVTQAVVVSEPMHLQREDVGRPVVCGAQVAEALGALLDLRLAEEEVGGRIEEPADARWVEVPAAAAALLGRPGARWCEHDRLLVDGVEVDWWVDEAGVTHAATPDGLARGLAWAAGRWSSRHAVAALLAEQGPAAEILLDESFGC